MENLNAEGFNRLDKIKKYNYVKKHGKYLISRQFRAFHIHLYRINEFYAEVWMRIAFDELAWIETIDLPQLKERYPEIKV